MAVLFAVIVPIVRWKLSLEKLVMMVILLMEMAVTVNVKLKLAILVLLLEDHHSALLSLLTPLVEIV